MRADQMISRQAITIGVDAALIDAIKTMREWRRRDSLRRTAGPFFATRAGAYWSENSAPIAALQARGVHS